MTTPQYLIITPHRGKRIAEKDTTGHGKYFTIPGHADAILLLKEDYEDGLNLFPFMVELNALDLETDSNQNSLFYSAKGRIHNNSLNIALV